MYNIGLISIKEDSGCTSLGIHIANYLASDKKNTVALFENRSKEEFKTIKADWYAAADGTFELNNVCYIPSGVDIPGKFDIEVHIVGVVNFLSELNDVFDKIYLCTDPDPNNIADIKEYFHETGTKADIILLGASKEQLDIYTENGLKCINISDKKENILPLALANHIALSMRMRGLIPPVYNKDAVYDETIFNWGEEDDNASSGGFFGLFGKKKKKKEIPAKEVGDDEPEVAEKTVNTVTDYQPSIYQRGSSEDKDYTFIDVPAPTPAKSPVLEDENNAVHSKSPVLEDENNAVHSKSPVLEDENNATHSKSPVLEDEDNTKESVKANGKSVNKPVKVDETPIKNTSKKPAPEKTDTHKKADNKPDAATKAELKKQQEIIRQKEKEAKELERKAQAEAKKRQKEEKGKALALEKAQKENEVLHFKATHDELCGVKNRVGFEEDVKTLKQYVLIMFDVNDLKGTNDNLGHKNGDKLLKTVSKTISDVIPDLYRYGGDEFIGIIRGVSKRDESKIVGLLTSIDETLAKASAKDKALNYSVAYGYAYSSEGKLEKVKELADERMYQDKAKKKSSSVKDPAPKQAVLPEKNPEKKKAERKSIFDALRVGNNEKETDTLKVGHLTIFVSGISHSVGTSFVAGSIASAMTDIYDEDVWLDLTEGGDFPDNYMVKPVHDDNDRFTAFKSPLYVEERGVYALLSDSDMGDMMRADINIMVTTASENDLREVAAFIKQNKDIAANWVFAFNHVHKAQEKTIHTAMKDYNYLIIPFHDNAEVDLDLRKTYIKLIDEFIG